MKKTIMVIGAHADDIEVQAGGTLAKYLDKGYKGVYILATDDSAGICLDENGEYKRFLLPRESKDERHLEAEEGAAIFGLKPIFLDFKQRFFCDRKDNFYYFGTEEYIRMAIPESRDCILSAPEKRNCVDLLKNIIIEEEPEIIFTHQLDLDPEHRNVSSLVFKAFKLAEQEVELGTLYNWGPTSAGEIKHIKPDMLIDISKYFKIKLESCYVYKSQVDETFKRIVNQRAEWWGKELGVPYGEAFIKISPADPDIYNRDQILAFWD